MLTQLESQANILKKRLHFPSPQWSLGTHTGANMESLLEALKTILGQVFE